MTMKTIVTSLATNLTRSLSTMKRTSFVAAAILAATSSHSLAEPANASPVSKQHIDISDEDLQSRFKGCSLFCAIGWSVTASSSLASQEGNKYSPKMLDDANLSTAWAEGAKNNGIGQFIEFHLKREYPGKVHFGGATLINGYAKTPELWASNGRIRELEMSINGKHVVMLTLEDTYHIQDLRFSAPEVKSGDVVRFTIRAVYPGTKYNDTCLTELILLGGH